MVAVFNNHLLASCGQSCEFSLELMHPDFVEGHYLLRGDRITRDEVFSRSQHDQGAVTQIARRASGTIDFWISGAALRHHRTAIGRSTRIGRTRLECFALAAQKTVNPPLLRAQLRGRGLRSKETHHPEKPESIHCPPCCAKEFPFGWGH